MAQIAYKVVVDNPSLRPGTVIEYRSAEGMESTEGYLLKEEAEWSAFLEENMQAQAQWAAEKAQAERAAKEAARMEALRATLIAGAILLVLSLRMPMAMSRPWRRLSLATLYGLLRLSQPY